MTPTTTPERAARITAIEEELGRRDWLGYERIQAPLVERRAGGRNVMTFIHPVRRAPP